MRFDAEADASRTVALDAVRAELEALVVPDGVPALQARVAALEAVAAAGPLDAAQRAGALGRRRPPTPRSAPSPRSAPALAGEREIEKFGTTGQSYAPDLTKIVDRLPRRDILRAIYFPSEAVDTKYTATVLVMRDGTTVRGLLVSETAQNIVLKTAAAEPTTVLKANVGKRSTERVSIMPDDLIDAVGDPGIRDVVAYLMQTGK